MDSPFKGPVPNRSKMRKKRMFFFRDQFVHFWEELEAVRWAQGTIYIAWKMCQAVFYDFRFFVTIQSSEVEVVTSTRSKSTILRKS